MKIKLKGFQDRFLFSEKRYPAMVSAVGTGKTMMLLLKIWNYCLQYPNSLALIVRKEYTDLRDSTLKDFEQYFSCSVDTNKEYKFKNKSVIMFRHGGELNVLKNINLSIAGIEQAEEFETEETFTFLRDRLRREGAPYRQLCIIANTNGHNWIWRLWKNTPNEEFVLSEATTFDNADNLPADFIKDLKAMEKQAPHHYNRYVMNSWEDTDTVDNVIQHNWVIKCVNKKLPTSASKRIVVCDVARYGDDETVIYGMSEKGVLEAQTYRDKSIMETAGLVLLMRDKIRANMIALDSVGIGAGLVDRIRELGRADINKGILSILEISFGSKASSDRYRNLKSEIWFEAAEKFQKEMVSVPNDSVLHEQLTVPRYKVFSDKVIQVESKEEIRKRLSTSSPDRAEAFIMGLYALGKAKSVYNPDIGVEMSEPKNMRPSW